MSEEQDLATKININEPTRKPTLLSIATNTDSPKSISGRRKFNKFSRETEPTPRLKTIRRGANCYNFQSFDDNDDVNDQIIDSLIEDLDNEITSTYKKTIVKSYLFKVLGFIAYIFIAISGIVVGTITLLDKDSDVGPVDYFIAALSYTITAVSSAIKIFPVGERSVTLRSNCIKLRDIKRNLISFQLEDIDAIEKVKQITAFHKELDEIQFEIFDDIGTSTKKKTTDEGDG